MHCAARYCTGYWILVTGMCRVYKVLANALRCWILHWELDTHKCTGYWALFTSVECRVYNVLGNALSSGYWLQCYRVLGALKTKMYFITLHSRLQCSNEVVARADHLVIRLHRSGI